MDEAYFLEHSELRRVYTPPRGSSQTQCQTPVTYQTHRKEHPYKWVAVLCKRVRFKLALYHGVKAALCNVKASEFLVFQLCYIDV